MPFVTFKELADLALMIAAVGFIFKDYLKIRDDREHDPIEALRQNRFSFNNFFGKGFKDAVILTAPAIALHELSHKIVAIAFGLEATFHAAYTWLGIGVLLKLLKVPLFFFVPGYVTHASDVVGPFAEALIAFSGPLVNLLLFAFSLIAIKQNWFDKKYFPYLHLTKQINLFLFAFNMIPFGPFDGANVFRSLMSAFGF